MTMIIAAILNDSNTILPIVEGTILRIYNTTTRQKKDFQNPALTLTEGRRGATLRFAEEQGATIFVSPPNTFCELSYTAAQKDDISFLHVEANTNFDTLEQSLLNEKYTVQATLPTHEIVPSK